MTRSGLDEFETLVIEFANTYKDVVCNAKTRGRNEIEWREEVIDVNSWTQGLLQRIDSLRSQFE